MAVKNKRRNTKLEKAHIEIMRLETEVENVKQQLSKVQSAREADLREMAAKIGIAQGAAFAWARSLAALIGACCHLDKEEILALRDFIAKTHSRIPHAEAVQTPEAGS